MADIGRGHACDIEDALRRQGVRFGEKELRHLLDRLVSCNLLSRVNSSYCVHRREYVRFVRDGHDHFERMQAKLLGNHKEEENVLKEVFGVE